MDYLERLEVIKRVWVESRHKALWHDTRAEREAYAEAEFDDLVDDIYDSAYEQGRSDALDAF
jgi:hypothetical protein